MTSIFLFFLDFFSFFSYRSVISTLQKERKNKYPPIPQNSKEVMDIYANFIDQFGKIDADKFFRGSLTCKCGGIAIIYINEAIRSKNKEFFYYVDATFACSPEHFYQVLVLSTSIYSKVRFFYYENNKFLFHKKFLFGI